MKNVHTTREGWLVDAVQVLGEEYFKAKNHTLPEKLGVSCGFPRAGKAHAIGQCWDPKASADGTVHMFICPTQADPVRVLDILLHELAHASVGLEVGHKKPFKDLIRAFGLEGKPTATFAKAGTPLHDRLGQIAEKLGPYPHAPMIKLTKPSKAGAWIRMVSTNHPTYKVLIGPKALEEFGAPLDPDGEEMIEVVRGKKANG